MLAVLLEGALAGLAIAAPVGPIGLLCIQRTLDKGRLFGFISGLGAASADLCYGFIVCGGFAFILHALIVVRMAIQLAGGVYLCYLGIKIYLSRPARAASTGPDGEKLFYAYLSTLLPTLSNPTTFFSFIGILANMGLNQAHIVASFLLVLGIFFGSALWWLLLSTFAGLFQKRISGKMMIWTNRVSGSLIIIFGLGTIYLFFCNFLK
ncbi:LysE family transporter [Terrilactibacillus sp. S3-3]|nr:LysE family transporter [Terrilactibacillus sp. S3-3]